MSATALYMLHKLANGKTKIGGVNWGNKGDMTKEFRGKIMFQEEATIGHKRSYFMCDMIDGRRVDFAEVCKAMLTNSDRGKNAVSNKPRTAWSLL